MQISEARFTVMTGHFHNEQAAMDLTSGYDIVMIGMNFKSRAILDIFSSFFTPVLLCIDF